MSLKNIEAIMVSEAETAFALIKHGDEEACEQAYHELITYEKLCMIADCGISEATWRTIHTLRFQAWEILRPREKDEDELREDEPEIELG